LPEGFKGIDFLTALTLVVEGGGFQVVQERGGVHGVSGACAEGILQRREDEAGRDHEGGEHARSAVFD